MANAVSLFSQLLRHFPRTELAFLVKKHGAERHAKGFACWGQFNAMPYSHLAPANSLREIFGEEGVRLVILHFAASDPTPLWHRR